MFKNTMVFETAISGAWMRFGALAILSLLIVLTTGFDTAWAEISYELKPLKRPYEADNFSLKTLKGKRVRLSDHRGKVVLINFWATWCPPCITEMPSMVKLYKSLKQRGFEVLAISVDKSSPKVVRKVAKDLGLLFGVLHDPDSITGTLYSISGVPYSFLLDTKGTIRYWAAGAVEWESPDVIATVKALLDEANIEAKN